MSLLEPAPQDNRNKQWTTEREEVLIELHARGLSASMIGREMGATRNAIIGKLNRMGKSTHEAPDLWTEEQTDCLKSSWATGITVKEVAASILKHCNVIKSTRAIAAKADRLHLTQRKVRKAQIRLGIPVFVEYQPSPTPQDFKPLNIPFMQLASLHCREVVGRGDDGLALYCGHRKAVDCSFCVVHQKINYHKPDVSQRKF